MDNLYHTMHGLETLYFLTFGLFSFLIVPGVLLHAPNKAGGVIAVFSAVLAYMIFGFEFTYPNADLSYMFSSPGFSKVVSTIADEQASYSNAADMFFNLPLIALAAAIVFIGYSHLSTLQIVISFGALGGIVLPLLHLYIWSESAGELGDFSDFAGGFVIAGFSSAIAIMGRLRNEHEDPPLTEFQGMLSLFFLLPGAVSLIILANLSIGTVESANYSSGTALWLIFAALAACLTSVLLLLFVSELSANETLTGSMCASIACVMLIAGDPVNAITMLMTGAVLGAIVVALMSTQLTNDSQLPPVLTGFFSGAIVGIAYLLIYGSDYNKIEMKALMAAAVYTLVSAILFRLITSLIPGQSRFGGHVNSSFFDN